MSHIFISYSRNDLDFAQKIVDALAANNLDTWIDWKSIPKGEYWEREIYRGIEEADAFLFLISPDSAASEMCNKEIAHAVKNGKRLLPLVIRKADSKIIHPEISKRNWIFCGEGQEDFNNAIDEIQQTIHTDYEWLRYHTQLQVKALEWERHKDPGRLLRGRGLREAEQQLADAGSRMDPQSTDLQRHYLLSSQRNEFRVRRQIITGLITGLAITVVLSIIAMTQRNLAVREARVARAGELAALALSDMNGSYDRALLFGIESLKLERNSRSLNSMSSLLQSRPDVARYLVGQSSFINSLAFSPDGHILASGSCGEWVTEVEVRCERGEIILWDTSNAVNAFQITRLSGHDMGVSSLAFSPDGKMLASADWDGTIILWEFRNRYAPQILTELKRNPVPVFSIAVSPNGRMLASAGGNSISLWDITVPSTPVKLASMVDEEDSFDLIESLVFSSDSRLLASAGDAGTIILWDLTSPASPGRLAVLVGHEAAVNSVAFGSDNQILASGSDDHTIILWDVSEPSRPGILKRYVAHDDFVESLAFSPDHQILASGGGDKKLILWDVSDPSSPGKVEERPGHSNYVRDIMFSPDGRFIASGDFLGTIILWNSVTDLVPLQLSELGGGSGEISSTAYRPDGRIFAASRNHTLTLWDVSDPAKPVLRSELGEGAGAITSMAFSSDGNLLATGDSEYLVALWDVSFPEKPLKLSAFTNHKNVVRNVIFNRDGRVLISSGGSEVTFWDISSPDSPRQFASVPGYDSSLILSPDNRMLAVGSYLVSGITLWNVMDMSHPQHLATMNDYAAILAFSPDNRLLAAGGCGAASDVMCTQGEIVIWDVSDPGQIRQKATMRVHSSKITGLSFSPDGNNLASGSTDGIIIWDLTNPALPEQQIRLFEMQENVLSLSYSPDGKSLGSGTSNGRLILWDLDPASWVKKACRTAGRNFSQSDWAQYFPGSPYPNRQANATCPEWPLDEATPPAANP